MVSVTRAPRATAPTNSVTMDKNPTWTMVKVWAATDAKISSTHAVCKIVSSERTGIGIGDIVGTVIERREEKGNGRDRKDPIVLGSDCRRHLEIKRLGFRWEGLEYLLRKLSSATGCLSI